MEELNKIEGLVVKLNEPMKSHTTFGIGGPADVFLEVQTEDALLRTLALLKQSQSPWFLMGDGANLLVSDKGIRGIVLQLAGQFEVVSCEGTKVRAGSAARISSVADIAAKHSLTGFEGVGTVPGSVGGAIVMNAGTHRGYIADVVTDIMVVDPAGHLVTLSNEECGFTYRGSRFQKERGFIITEVSLQLMQGESEKIAAELDAMRKHRRDTQPQGKSAGCFFKNPTGGSAGKLIEAAGLKGTRIGGAFVADEHANFIINDSTATADDVLKLAQYVREIIREKNDIDLEFEVRIVGDW